MRAEQGTKTERNAAMKRSRRELRIRVAITAGTLHP
jgi:hypothetical protein